MFTGPDASGSAGPDQLLGSIIMEISKWSWTRGDMVQRGQSNVAEDKNKLCLARRSTTPPRHVDEAGVNAAWESLDKFLY